MNLTYSAKVFDVADLTEAMRIILTPQGGQDTEERWRQETPYLGGLIETSLGIMPGQVLLDFGCGIGRLAKEMIGRTGVRVLGVDISLSMRALGSFYVGNEDFVAVSPQMLAAMADRGLRVDGAIAVWVLQHCSMPAADLELIRSALQPGGRFFVVNNQFRAVPTTGDTWANDGIDVRALAQDRFHEVACGVLDPCVVGQYVSEKTWWAVFNKADDAAEE